MTERISMQAAEVAKKKPFTQFLVNHGNDDAYQLHELKDRILGILSQHPGKKIVLFTEDSEGDPVKAARKQELVLRGMRPSDAQLALRYDLPIQGENDPDTVPTLQKKDIPSTHLSHTVERYSGFIGHSLRMMDEITNQYPGQIVWVQETKGERVEAAEKANRAALRKKGYLYATGFVFGQKSFERKRDLYTHLADLSRIREEENAPRIVDAMQSEEVVAGFGWMGSGHTGISHELRADTYITRVIPNKVDGVYTFDPIATLVRRRRFYPDREIEVDEIRDAIRASEKVERESGKLYFLGEKLAKGYSVNPLYYGKAKAQKDQELAKRKHDEYRKLREEETSSQKSISEPPTEIFRSECTQTRRTSNKEVQLPPEPIVGETADMSIEAQEVERRDRVVKKDIRKSK